MVRVRGNKNSGHARVTNKSRRQWNAREKLAIVTYLEKHPSQSVRATATKFNIEPKQVSTIVKHDFSCPQVRIETVFAPQLSIVVLFGRSNDNGVSSMLPIKARG